MSSGALVLTFSRADYAADVQFLVEASSDLQRWSAASPAPALIMLADDGRVRRVAARVPSGGASRGFLRLRVARAP